MTARNVVNSLNKETFKAITSLVNLIGTPVLIIIGNILIPKVNTVIENQNKWYTIMTEQERKLNRDSTDIGKIRESDKLIIVKQDATIDALKINSEIGIEWKVDYDKRKEELEDDSRFLNP